MARLSLLPKGTDQFNFVGRDPITHEEVWANCDFCKSQGEIETEDENGRSGNDGSHKTN